MLLNSPRVQQRVSVLLATELENYIAATGCYVPCFYKSLPYAWDKALNVKLDLNWYYIYEWSWN